MGNSRLADVRDKPARSKFKAYAIGYVHIDIAEVRTEEGKLQLFVGIDRTSKLAFVKLETKATRMIACQLLRDLIDAFPYQLHTILTDNGVQFCHPLRYRNGPTARFAGHLFDRICAENGIEHPRLQARSAEGRARHAGSTPRCGCRPGHRLTKPNHPWTNGQVERMNWTIKA